MILGKDDSVYGVKKASSGNIENSIRAKKGEGQSVHVCCVDL